MPQLQSKSFRHNNKREEVVPERITDGKHNYVRLYVIFIHEMFTFGLLFPFESIVSSYSTPFYAEKSHNIRYHTVVPMASPRDNNSQRRSMYPLQLERELEQSEMPRFSYAATSEQREIPVPEPSSPPLNPMYVPTSFVQAQQQDEYNKDASSAPIAFKV